MAASPCFPEPLFRGFISERLLNRLVLRQDGQHAQRSAVRSPAEGAFPAESSYPPPSPFAWCLLSLRGAGRLERIGGPWVPPRFRRQPSIEYASWPGHTTSR